MKTSKLKSIEALLRGYLLFRVYVNDEMRVFSLYHKARDYRLSYPNAKYILFVGWNVWKYIGDLVTKKPNAGARCFYLKLANA